MTEGWLVIVPTPVCFSVSCTATTLPLSCPVKLLLQTSSRPSWRASCRMRRSGRWQITSLTRCCASSLEGCAVLAIQQAQSIHHLRPVLLQGQSLEDTRVQVLELIHKYSSR